MRFCSFKVFNYKGYVETEEIKLTPGFNIIVGQNNVGKTALLEVLSLKFGNKPPINGTSPNGNSSLEFTLETNGEEIQTIFRTKPQSSSFIPLGFKQYNNNPNKVLDRVATFDYLEKAVIFKAKCDYGHIADAYPVSYEIQYKNNTGLSIDDFLNRSNLNLSQVQLVTLPWTQNIAFVLSHELQDRSYLFKAERQNIGSLKFLDTKELNPDASNLPLVLHHLYNHEPELFIKYMDLVKRVFKDDIYRITVPNTAVNTEILIWPDSLNHQLRLPLSECGSGLSQILAMLYIIVTSQFPRIILIDEPQNFLHPGAVRRLFEIFRENPQHQYIITTHSPVALMSAEPENILLVRKCKGESKIEEIDTSDNEIVQLMLLEIGASLSDLFGADDILWVEGPTEEKCFPLIVRELVKQPLLATKILSLKHTGDLESKHVDLVLDIYNKLSKGSSLIPPKVGIVLDLERRDAKQAKELTDKGITLLNRHMYENYVLNPGAIAFLMNKLNIRNGAVTKEDIVDWMKIHGSEKKYETQCDYEKDYPEWIKEVHAAKILHDLISEFSMQEHSYKDRKIEYGIELTRWLIENSPQDLDEVKNLLAVLLKRRTNIHS